MTEQERIDRQFENWFASQPGYGNAGQGWPLEIWWKRNNGNWVSTFNQGIGNTFHVGYGNTAKIIKNFPDADGVLRDKIIAPFMLLSYKVKGVNKEKLYAYPAVAEHPVDNVSIRYPLEKLRIYFFYRDIQDPRWFPIEDYRKEAFLNIVKPSRTIGDLVLVEQTGSLEQELPSGYTSGTL